MTNIILSDDGVHCKNTFQTVTLFCLIKSLQVAGTVELNILKNVKLHVRQIANLIEAINVVTEGLNNERN